MHASRARHGRRIKWLAVGAIALATTVLNPLAAFGQSSYSAQFCRKLVRPPGVYFAGVTTSQCATKFTTNDGYVGILVTLRGVRDPGQAVLELLDPDQASVWTGRYTLNTEPGGSTTFYLWKVLPLAADDTALAAEGFPPDRIIQVQGKPVRERTGDWTLRVRFGGGWPIPFKFTVAAP